MPPVVPADRAVVRPAYLQPFAAALAFIRAIELKSDWFGPQQPVTPQAPTGTPPRVRDYPVGYNIAYTPRSEEEISFSQLREIARLWDLVALCIETRKDQVAAVPWNIRPKQLPDEPRAEYQQRAKGVDGIAKLTEVYERPDGTLKWHEWVRKLVHEHLVIDAVCIYPRKVGGRTYADLLDGATIKVLIDSEGRRPEPPSVAYQQIIKGVPAFDFTQDDLRYHLRTARADHIYGYSPVEQIIYTINFGLRRSLYKLAYYTEGNIPEAIIQMPDNWPIDKIRQFSEWWNSILGGQVDVRRRAHFIPSIGGPNAITFTKPDSLKDEMDEWLARVVCYCFNLPVQPFVREMNRATAETALAEAKAEGLQPILNWIKAIQDDSLATIYGRPDLEWVWEEDVEPDPLKRAQIQSERIRSAISTINEIREENGDDPVPGGDVVGVVTGSGFIPITISAMPPSAPEEGAGAPAARLLRLRRTRKYSPDQARDEHGRWTEEGGGAGLGTAWESGATYPQGVPLPVEGHPGEVSLGPAVRTTVSHAAPGEEWYQRHIRDSKGEEIGGMIFQRHGTELEIKYVEGPNADSLSVREAHSLLRQLRAEGITRVHGEKAPSAGRPTGAPYTIDLTPHKGTD